MEPFFFESSGIELFGVYHPAHDSGANKGIVICPPYIAELNRVYPTLRRIAERWASAGVHVLRIDYRATGDSFGEWEHAGPQAWQQDVVQAASELKEISGVRRLALAGVRFGALMAALSAESCGASELILWDPVADGVDYRRELERVHRKLIGLHVGLSPEELAQANRELCGFEIAEWMDAEFPGMSVPDKLAASVERVTIVETAGRTVGDQLSEMWQNESVDVRRCQADFDCQWEAEPDALLNAPPVIEELARCL